MLSGVADKVTDAFALTVFLLCSYQELPFPGVSWSVGRWYDEACAPPPWNCAIHWRASRRIRTLCGRWCSIWQAWWVFRFLQCFAEFPDHLFFFFFFHKIGRKLLFIVFITLITIGLEFGLLTKITFWSLLKVPFKTDLLVKTVWKNSVAKLV